MHVFGIYRLGWIVVFIDYLLGVGRSGCRVFLALVLLSHTLVAWSSICVVDWGFWSIALVALAEVLSA